MKTILLSTLIAVGTLGVATAALADDASQTGNYVKDSVITAKVKTKLAEKHMSTLTNIQVDTDDRGVVWLSGHAPSKDASDLAAMIAKDTDGVTDVHNHIVVQP
jgi:hyperosmotically inducible protein